MNREKYRLNIGCVVDTIIYEYQAKVWGGIVREAKEKDVNLLTFAGGVTYSNHFLGINADHVYNLANPQNVDGLIVLSATLGSYASGDFGKKYLPLPMVSVGLEIEDMPSILIDNKGGMKQALSHLIEDHGHKDIAFIRGLAYNPEAEERYQAYLETLAEHNIPIKEELIVTGNFLRPSGQKAAEVLLDERKVKFDALAAADGNMVLGALDELKERGIRVPQEVAMVGFDDLEETKLVQPPLTIVRQPLLNIGIKALDMLLDLIEGKQVPEKIILPTELIIRQSCGCKSFLVSKAGEKIELGKKSLNALPKPEILHRISESTGENSDLYPLLDDLLSSLVVSLKEESSDKFLENLEQCLLATEQGSYPTEIWQKIIISLRQEILPYIGEREIVFAENLFHQAQLLIGEIKERGERYKGLKILNETIRISNISQRIISTFDFEKLSQVLTEELKKLKIPGCYLALYQENENSPQARLILAYSESHIEAKDIGTWFSPQQLLPGDLAHPPYRRDFLIQSLHFEDKVLGYIVFELDSKDGFMYEMLRGQISSAIYGAIIFNKYVNTLGELEKQVQELSLLNEIGQAVNSAMELDKLWELIYQQTSRLVDFQSLYITLYDEEKQELRTVFDVLKGRRRIDREKPRPFARGRTEYIIREKKPLLIRGNVQKIYEQLQIVSSDKEAKAFAGVPIMARGKVIGVIAAQHYESDDAYDEHTIELLSAIANQAGIAIENARLFEATKKLATIDPLTGVWNRRSLEEALQREKDRSERFHHSFSILMLDVDNLKILNDTYGHLLGDEVIKTIARTIKSSCRRIDMVGRYGGDEFVVILPETDRKGAVKVSEKILSRIKSKSLTAPDGTKIPLSVSIGIASYPLDAEDVEKLLSLADAAMYRAKLTGGGRAVVISEEVEETPVPFDALGGLLMAINSKDNYTLKHSLDVARVACTLGRALGLPEEDIKTLEIAGKLHDIGKIGISSSILKKPGPLTPEEWEIIKEHPTLGRLIMQHLSQLEVVLQTILYHHERCDGKGYPEGVQRENIPLLARILASADAYCAMRSNHPYRRALTKEEAIEEIKRNMGTQFDPELAKKLIELIERGEIEL